GCVRLPYWGQAGPRARQRAADDGDVNYVWRHLPLNDVHPYAQQAAEAAEAAGAQGKFWEVPDPLLAPQHAVHPPDLIRYAQQLGLDFDTFTDDLRRHDGATR